MANEITSIVAAAGWPTNTVKGAWDLAFHTALNAMPVCRQLVDVRPQRPTHRGDSVTLQITNNFSEATITAWKTPLAEESDVDSTRIPATSTVVLTPAEYGGASTRTLKLANRSMVPVDPEIVRDLADGCGKVADELLQDQMVTGSQVYRGGGKATTNLITAADTLNAAILRKAYTKLHTNQVQTRDGEFYVAVVHPHVVYDLRTETGSGSWRVPQEYGTDQRRIYTGEIGEFEGFRFLQNPRTRNANDGASSAQVYRSFFLGREALAEAVVTEAGTVLSPQVDKLRRFNTVGWYMDLAFKIFRDQAIVRSETGTAMS